MMPFTYGVSPHLSQSHICRSEPTPKLGSTLPLYDSKSTVTRLIRILGVGFTACVFLPDFHRHLHRHLSVTVSIQMEMLCYYATRFRLYLITTSRWWVLDHFSLTLPPLVLFLERVLVTWIDELSKMTTRPVIRRISRRHCIGCHMIGYRGAPIAFADEPRGVLPKGAHLFRSTLVPSLRGCPLVVISRCRASPQLISAIIYTPMRYAYTIDPCVNAFH